MKSLGARRSASSSIWELLMATPLRSSSSSSDATVVGLRGLRNDYGPVKSCPNGKWEAFLAPRTAFVYIHFGCRGGS